MFANCCCGTRLLLIHWIAFGASFGIACNGGRGEVGEISVGGRTKPNRTPSLQFPRLSAVRRSSLLCSIDSARR
ncbi:hypothetical protein BJL96_14225 [Burkholderia cenocepacia]|nr:hypothetical protein A3203_37665 [Burkholderia cenocepacia]NGO94833.1 hypothetical protein [Burkholderia cenocepacia]